MNRYRIAYWSRNLFGLALVLLGIWLIVFFKASTAENLLLKQYHTPLGAAMFPLGILFIGGMENLLRMSIGLGVCLIGVFALLYFMPLRSTTLGQLVTNFGAPATMAGGIFLMLSFGAMSKKR
jgi:protein-S-isoprenylcysteine O-methyltransferase Ste14